MLVEIMLKIAEAEEAQRDHTYRPRPSMAGPQRCIRSMVYNRLNYPRKPIGGRMLLRLEAAGLSELSTDSIISKTAYRLHSAQLKLPECFQVRGKWYGGSIDGVLTDLTGQDYLYEKKSLNYWVFNRYAEGDDVPIDYFHQHGIYFNGIQKIAPLTKGIILLENAMTSHFAEYQTSWKDGALTVERVKTFYDEKEINLVIPNLVKETEKKFEEVEAHAEKKELPKRPYFQSDWHCQYCSYGDECWSNYVEETKDRQTGIDLTALLGSKMIALDEYETIKNQRKMLEAQEDTISESIKLIMRESETSEGTAAGYSIKLATSERSQLIKELVPANAYRKVPTERLTVKKIKGGK